MLCMGLLEIKCPYSEGDKAPAGITEKAFFMAQDDGRMQLKKSHDYLYQVQGQLAICGYDYCDFVCWTPHGMVVDRIKADPIFLKK